MNKLSLVVLASALAGAANAAVTINLGSLINGSMPSGSYPQLTAKLEQDGTNAVKLTMTNNMVPSNYVHDWMFNVNGAVSTIARLSGETAALSFNNNGGSQVKGGIFDLVFTYGNGDFSGGDSSVYRLTGTGLTEGSFISYSANELKNNGSIDNLGGWLSAADVRGFGSSGSIGTKAYSQAVPEPASMAALGLGAIGLLKRRKKA